MIITRLNGGLGNQMFQYALGRKMSIKNNSLFKLDVSDYTSCNPRAYGLSHFNIIENIATVRESQNAKRLSWFKRKILRKFNVGFDPKILNKKDDIYLDGFWQSEKYFNDVEEIIRQDFKLRRKMSHSAEIMLDMIQNAEVSISIHIRRGDYVESSKTNEYHGTCSAEYYNKALILLAEKLPKNDLAKIHLFVFSDDIEWVKKNLSFPYAATFVSNPSIPDYEELILMSRCSHHIIANSSFSWWGSWLNANPQKIVIAPKKWFDTKPNVYKDIAPNSWIKI